MPTGGSQSPRRRALLPIPVLPPVAQLPVGIPVARWVADPVEPAIVAPVEPGSKAPLTGLEVTLLVPGRWSSSSGLVYVQASPGRVKLLEWALPLRRHCPVWNPDPV